MVSQKWTPFPTAISQKRSVQGGNDRVGARVSNTAGFLLKGNHKLDA